MAKYLYKEMFLQSMGLLGDETKYGNRDGEHQSRSYGTWMGYEIMDSVENSTVEEDVVEVVRCKDCKHSDKELALRSDGIWCGYWGTDPEQDDFCSYGERKDNERKTD